MAVQPLPFSQSVTKTNMHFLTRLGINCEINDEVILKFRAPLSKQPNRHAIRYDTYFHVPFTVALFFHTDFFPSESSPREFQVVKPANRAGPYFRRHKKNNKTRGHDSTSMNSISCSREGKEGEKKSFPVFRSLDMSSVMSGKGAKN